MRANERVLVAKIESMKVHLILSASLIVACQSLSHAQDVTVTAKAPPDESISQSYMALDQECRNLVSKHDSDNAVIACKKVADEADKYDPKTHFITRRGAYVFYTTSLIQAKKYQDAIQVSGKAVAVVQLGHDDASGGSAAYGVRGQAEAFAGDLASADRDLGKAESYERDGLNSPAGRELGFVYSRTLKGLLMFHAQVLTAMGKQDAAANKAAEAAKF
jgi:hypothetical protein